MHLLWVGEIDPTLRSYLGAEMAAAEATGTLHIAGWRDDIGELLSAADVLLLTSREDPFPTAVLEALSAGLPVIAFEGSGGIPELLRRHGAGVSVKMADAEAMARRLVGTARAGRARDGRAARSAAIRAEHCFDSYAAGLLRLAQPGLQAISVVVPSYNYARYLPARLASIFTQTYPVGEMIVLDDHSDDGSAKLARGTAAQWGREVTVIENAENSGSVFRQWQRAAEQATGEFLWIAEADDGSDPTFLERLMQAMAGAPDAVLAFTDSRCIDAQDRLIRPSYQSYYAESAGIGALSRDDVFQADGFARRFLTERNLILNVSGVLWRRTALRDALHRCAADLPSLRWPPTGASTSNCWPARTASVVYVAAPLNIHRRHGESVTHRLAWRRHVQEIARLQAVAARRLAIDRGGRERQKATCRHCRAGRILDRRMRGEYCFALTQPAINLFASCWDRPRVPPFPAAEPSPKKRSGKHQMLSEWDVIPEDLQLTLTREALRRATDAIAGRRRPWRMKWRAACLPIAAARTRYDCLPRYYG